MAYSAKKKEVYEIIEDFEKAKSRKDKIEILKAHGDNIALRDIIQGALDERIHWIIPTGEPPYEPSSEESHPSTLARKHRDFVYFAKRGPGEKMMAVKRESMFISLLESIHPKDAKLVIAMINKKQPAKGLTKKIAQEVYPNLGIK